jgi:hypothetical protein
MKTKLATRSGFFNPGVSISVALCALGALTALLALSLSTSRTAQAQSPQQNQTAGQLSAEDAKALAEGLKPLINDSAEGLVPVKRADGSSYIDLQGRFENVTVAKINPDGTVSQACVNSHESAAAFFGINPQLLDPALKAQPQQLSDR